MRLKSLNRRRGNGSWPDGPRSFSGRVLEKASNCCCGKILTKLWKQCSASQQRGPSSPRTRENRSSKTSWINTPKGHRSAVTDPSCVLPHMDLDSMDPDLLKMVLIKEEPPEEQSASVDLQDPDHLHIKEEQEEVRTSLEGEQIQLKDEETDPARFPFTTVCIKSEYDEEKPLFSQLHEQQIEDRDVPSSSSAVQMTAEPGRGAETSHNPDVNHHQQTTDSETEGSGAEEDDVNLDTELLGPGPETGDENNDGNESRSSASDVKPVNKFFSCPECGKKFLHEWSLQKHTRVTGHSAEWSSEYLVYEKCVGVEQHVDSCKKVQTQLKSFSCDECGKVFNHKTNLKSHMRVHTGQKPFSCEFCELRFSHNTNLKSHLRVHTGQKPFACEFCGLTFSHKTSVNRHIRVHTGQKPFECEFCGQRFSQKTSLNRHITVHTGEKPFECDICGQKLSNKTYLNSHMSVHTGQKPFPCEICGQRFSQKTYLNSHMSVHTGQKPFTCNICEQKFSHKTSLSRHMIIHTGQKPFACELCGQNFSQKTSLNRHMGVHTGQKPFSCELCEQRFSHRPSLNRHMRVHTGQKELLELEEYPKGAM
nr:gastrula zinc finger protein XlCGF57.1 [Nothobranchius furzeri]